MDIRNPEFVRITNYTEHHYEKAEYIKKKKKEIDALFSVDLLHASPPLAMLESDNNRFISIGEE